MKWFHEVQKILSFGQPQNRSLFGVSRGMQLGRGDVLLVEHILTETPDCNVMIEHGCGPGLQTIYWAVAMAIRQGDVCVYNARRPTYSKYWPANVKLYRDPISAPCIADVADGRPAIIIVDGGDRLPIVSECSRTAPIGSTLLIHDWIPHRYPDFVEEASNSLMQYGWSTCNTLTAAALGSRFVVWRRIREHKEGPDHGGDWCEGSQHNDNHGGEWCDGRDLTIE